MTRKTNRKRVEGVALLLVLATTLFVSGVFGAILVHFKSTVSMQRHALRTLRARALALGAWSASEKGIAEEGSAFKGFGEKDLGKGTISLEVRFDAEAKTALIVARGTVPSEKGGVGATVFASVSFDDSKPEGERLVRVESLRLD